MDEGNNNWKFLQNIPELDPPSEDIQESYTPTDEELRVIPFANPCWRLVAALLDITFVLFVIFSNNIFRNVDMVGGLSSAIHYIFAVIAKQTEISQPALAPIIVASCGLFGVMFVYYLFFEATLGTTPGKILSGLKVCSELNEELPFSNAFARNIFRIVAIIPFGLGFVPVLFTRYRQGLHDLLGGTVVLRKIDTPTWQALLGSLLSITISTTSLVFIATIHFSDEISLLQKIYSQLP